MRMFLTIAAASMLMPTIATAQNSSDKSAPKKSAMHKKHRAGTSYSNATGNTTSGQPSSSTHPNPSTDNGAAPR